MLNFWSCECPHSERTDKLIKPRLAEWGGPVVLLPIASNRNESAEALRAAAAARALPTILVDRDCAIANLYEARTTPHLFVIDRAGTLIYRGALDDATFRQRAASRSFLNEAVEALLDGKLPGLTESSPYGCTIVREV